MTDIPTDVLAKAMAAIGRPDIQIGPATIDPDDVDFALLTESEREQFLRQQSEAQRHQPDPVPTGTPELRSSTEPTSSYQSVVTLVVRTDVPIDVGQVVQRLRDFKGIEDVQVVGSLKL